MAAKSFSKSVLVVIQLYLVVGITVTNATCIYTSIENATIEPGDPLQVVCSASEDITVDSQICEISVPDDTVITLTNYAGAPITNYAGAPITNYVEILTEFDGNQTDVTFFINALIDDIADTYGIMLTGTLNCGGSPNDMFILQINAINDHRPVFGSEEYYISGLIEVFPPHFDLLQVYGLSISSTDGDTNGDSSSLMNFSIISGNDNGTFIIEKDANNCNYTVCFVILLVDGSIDFRQNPQYDLVLQVQDEGTPSLSSTANLTITIKDVDNLIPKFESTFYYSTIDTINIGSFELTMTPSPIYAVDQDTGMNASIEYSLVIDSCGPSCDMISQAFTIGLFTGVITFDSDVNVDPNNIGFVTFGVQATQTDNADQLALAIVTITLPPFSPLITDTSTQMTSTETMTTYCTAQSNNFDPTSPPIHNATTGFPTSISSATTPSIPTCPELNSSNIGQIIFVSELTPINTTIVQITDTSSVAEKQFTLKGGDLYFDIDQHGNIFIKTNLQTDNFTLTVAITSDNDPNLNNTAQINITVVEEQSFPVLPANVYQISIDEEVEDTTLLVDLSSLYENTGDANYSIIKASQSPEKFSIDCATGKLYAISAFDCESGETSIDVKVQVDQIDQESTETEDHINLAYNQFLVNVIINDLNDNPPLFYGDNIVNGHLTLAISSYTSSGQQVIQLQTNDADVDPENRVTYYKMENTDKFYVDQNTGLLLASKSLNSLDDAYYNVTAKATNDLSGTSEDSLSIMIVMLQEQEILIINYGYPIEYFENNHVQILNNLTSSINSGTSSDRAVQIGGLKWITADQNSTKVYLYGLQGNNPMDHSDLMNLISNNGKAFSSNSFETETAETYDQSPDAQPNYIEMDETSYKIGISILTVILSISLIGGVVYGWYVFKKEKKLWKLYGDKNDKIKNSNKHVNNEMQLEEIKGSSKNH